MKKIIIAMLILVQCKSYFQNVERRGNEERFDTFQLIFEEIR